MKTLSALVVIAVLGSVAGFVYSGEHHDVATTALASVRDDPHAVVERFNQALAAGDAATARALLLPGVLIFESGGAETSAEEYASHHLPADIEFMAGLKREQLSQLGGGDDSSAWVATRSRLSGVYNGKALDLDSTETMTMTKTADGWRIAHIHWSSAPRGHGDP